MSKRIIINTSNLKKGGALQVALSFVQEAVKFTEIEFCIILGRASQKLIDAKDFENIPTIHFREVPIHPSDSLLALGYFRKALSKIEEEFKPDSVITVFGPCYWTPKARHIMGFGNGYLLYEDSFFFTQWQGWHSWLYKIKKWYHRYLLKREADLYWTETEDSKQRLAAFIRKPESQIVVAGNTCSNLFRQQPYAVVADLQKGKKLRLLYPADYYIHKGFEFIRAVLKRLEQEGIEVEFLVTLEQKEYQQLFSECSNVINLGTIDPVFCPFMYQQADIIFVPSLLEIFSAVYPEAMYMQKPVVTTDLPFARDVCGEAALYFKPGDVEEAVRRIKEIVFDKAMENDLIRKGLERVKDFDLPEHRFAKILNKVLAKDWVDSRTIQKEKIG